MRIVVRADAGITQGSGHVMRCLTLAEALRADGHEVLLLSSIEGIPWLSEHIAALGVEVRRVTADSLETDAVLAEAPDRVVVDSYLIDAAAIGALDARVPVLAVVDGELRGIAASLYLDQNLGAETLDRPLPAGSRMLAGAPYALVRDAVLAARRPRPWRIDGRPRVLVVMGGTDPTGSIVEVAGRLRALPEPVLLTLVVPPAHRSAVAELLEARDGVELIDPSPDIASLYAAADVVVSAAGTTSWEVCSLGLPAVLIAVVGNQSDGLERMLQRGVVDGIDLTGPGAGLDRLAPLLERLLADEPRRRALSQNATALFDGLGKRRVAEALAAPLTPRLG